MKKTLTKKRPWVAFFSHTGSEIAQLSYELITEPDLVCTNTNVLPRTPFSNEILRDKWTEHDYREILCRFDNPVVTLHGWMKIIPAQICEEFEIYNGHPALIDTYPELKGKDKQEDVINQTEKYPVIGSVIHKCTSVLDGGEILVSERVPNIRVHNRDLIYTILKDTSLRTWLGFLPNIL